MPIRKYIQPLSQVTGTNSKCQKRNNSNNNEQYK